MMNQDYFALAVKLAFANTPIIKDMREIARAIGITGHLRSVAECPACAPCETCQQHMASAWGELTGPDRPVGWPRCIRCGRATLDGHMTCGSTACDKGSVRDRYVHS